MVRPSCCFWLPVAGGGGSAPPPQTGGAAASAISGLEITWQARPENILIWQNEEVSRPIFRVDRTDGDGLSVHYTLGGPDAGLIS